MTEATIKLTYDGPTAIITLDRPERRNAISLQMMDEIVEACTRLDADNAVRTVIISGGETCFSSGADLTEALTVKTAADGRKFFGSLRRLNAAVDSLSKPVIAAIEGFCMTGGCELALACDLRVAGAGATFGITSARIGTIAGAGGTQRLPRVVGLSILSGSHRLLHRWFTDNPSPSGARSADKRASLQRHPYIRDLHAETDPKARTERFFGREEVVDGIPLQVLENTASAGEVILMHPLLLHAAPTVNAGRWPRFLLNADILAG